MIHWLRRWGFAAGLCVVLIYAFPYFPRIHNANEVPRVYLVQAMVDEGTFAIDAGVARWGKTSDLAKWNGHYYSNKAPGSSMLAIPGYVVLKGVAALRGTPPTLGEMTWVARFTTGVLPQLAFLVLLWGFLARFTADVVVRRGVIVAYALGSMALVYSLVFFSHQLSAICIASAWILAHQVTSDERGGRWMLAAGFLAGCAPLCDYQAAFAGVPVAIAIGWRVWSRPDRWRLVAMAAGAAAVPIALLLAYHAACFDSPFRTGYETSEVWGAQYHQKGFLGLTALRWSAFYESFLSPANGLVLLSPWVLLAIPGTVILWRRDEPRDREVALVGAAVAVIYVLFISAINFWRGGWSVGPRYITAMLPFLLPAVAAALATVDAKAVLRGLAYGAIGVGVVVYATTAVMYPHWPERYPDPLYEITFRLMRDGHAPYSLGWAVGLRGVASLVPYLAVVGALVASALVPARRYVRSAVIAGAVAVIVIAAYGLFPRGDAADDRAYREVVAPSMPR